MTAGERLRVVFFIDGLLTDLGGTERQFLELLRRLDRKAFDPFLVLLKETPWSKGRELPCPSAVLGYAGFLRPGFPAVVSRLRALLSDKKPHVLHTFFTEATIVAWMATFGLRPPVMLSSRRDTGMGSSLPWYHALYGKLMPLVDRRYDGIVANGELVKRHVLESEGVPEGKVKVVYNGIALPPDDGPEPPLFRDLPAGFRVGAVANLKAVKRLDLLLDALALMRDRHGVNDFAAVVLGEGTERKALEDRAARLGLTERVRFPGAVRDVTDHLRRLDAAVLCSDREGLSNALLEAMACGKPVVATAVGEAPAIVDDGSGFLVPPGDAGALAEALARLAKDPELARRLGRGARAKVERTFSWEKCMESLEGYYKASSAGAGRGA